MAKTRQNQDIKNFKWAAKKVWDFLWNEDSLWSWLVSLALAFIIVKFIFFPALSLMLGTSLPLVVIESSSMHHQGSLFKTITGFGLFEQDSIESWYEDNYRWYQDRGLTLDDVKKWRFESGMDKGDIIVVYGKNIDELELGDVVIFEAGQRRPVIHRVVDIYEEGNETFISTKGDNNDGQLSFEITISSDQLIGTALIRIPKIGWVKLVFVELIQKVF